VRLARRGSRSWRDTAFAVLDFETTGLDPRRDHVLSFGVVRVEGGRVRLGESVYRVVRPPVPLPPASIRVHGIRPGDLTEAPVLGDVVDELFLALEGRDLVAHAAGVELGFLEQLRVRHRGPRVRQAIDVIDLAGSLAALDRGAPVPASPRLAALADTFGVPVARTHHAFGDALTTAQLFVVLATRMERLGAGRLRDLARPRRSQFATSFVPATP
jgi:DNA polymerase III subunit epsilon